MLKLKQNRLFFGMFSFVVLLVEGRADLFDVPEHVRVKLVGAVQRHRNRTDEFYSLKLINLQLT